MVQYLKMKKHEATVLVQFLSTDGASCACSFRLFVTKRSFLLPLTHFHRLHRGLNEVAAKAPQRHYSCV